MHYLFEESDSLNRPIECFVYDTAKENFPVKNHWHYFMEIIYMLEGSAKMYSDNQSYILEPGDMILFHPRAVHAVYSADTRPLKYLVLKFDIYKFNATPACAPRLSGVFGCAKRKNMNIFFPSVETAEMSCKHLIQNCVNEIEKANYGYDLVIKAYIYNLLINIVRKWLNDGLIIDDSGCHDENDVTIDSLTEYIDSNIGDGLRVSSLAEKCGMCYSGFAQKFREIYGMSCKEYIERMRIFRVEEFLMFTDYDLSYISQETGFSDCSHLIKSFKKLRGVTPKQFRMTKKPYNNGGKQNES